MARKVDQSKIEKKVKKGSNETTVALNLPNEITMDLVQANEFRHYEIFNVLTGLFFSAAVGFWTASAGQSDLTLKWIGGVFTLFTIIFALIAIYYRGRVFHGSIQRVAKMSDFK